MGHEISPGHEGVLPSHFLLKIIEGLGDLVVQYGLKGIDLAIFVQIVDANRADGAFRPPRLRSLFRPPRSARDLRWPPSHRAGGGFPLLPPHLDHIRHARTQEIVDVRDVRQKTLKGRPKSLMSWKFRTKKRQVLRKQGEIPSLVPDGPYKGRRHRRGLDVRPPFLQEA
jgi:hypothetical protein